jgi:pSer/pThr/pTyr-binding forkhead associated (FHA) protein
VPDLRPAVNAKTYLSVRRNTVGRKHAAVWYARWLFWFEDHESVNGTFVNAERVSGMSPLVSGDEVTFDTYRFSFIIMEPDDVCASFDPLDLDKTRFRGT